MSAPLSRAQILLVEDADDDVFFFLRALQHSGATAEITHVGDGAAAVDHLRRALAGEVKMSDLIFLDIKLPIMTGLEVLEWIKGQPFRPRPMVAVLSGSEQSDDIERAMTLDVSAYYVKPVLPHQLRVRIAECMAARGAENAEREAS